MLRRQADPDDRRPDQASAARSAAHTASTCPAESQFPDGRTRPRDANDSHAGSSSGGDATSDPVPASRWPSCIACCDNRRLPARTGWLPRVDLDTGLALTVEAYRAAGNWIYEDAAVSVG